ncbi:MAG: GntR family transcriptional regulator [Pseudomonadota bacterium]
MAKAQPLYLQVKDNLVARLNGGEWPPGAVIPSEMALAAELNVSQGTVRKAIDLLCSDGALRRAQGKGTFVSKQTEELADDRFFPLFAQDGNRANPELYRQVAAHRPATAAQARALGIGEQASVHVIERVLTLAGSRAITEVIAVGADLMPGLSDLDPLPTSLYPLYQMRFGISVLDAQETLSAVNANGQQARRLKIPAGTALLRSERVALDLLGRRVEHRISYYLTRSHRFAVARG